MTSHAARRIPFEGIDNFRDFGGYPTREGRRVKAGVLYRSAGHSRASDRDLESLAELGIGIVVDLRSAEERSREPSRHPPSFRGAVILNDDDAGEDGWSRHVATGEMSVEANRAYLMRYYTDAPFDPRHIDLFRRYFRALAEGDARVLIHCAAGKDRTGILAALTHHVLGVHPDDMIHDYLLTNDPERMALRLPQVIAAIESVSGRTPDPEAALTIMGVDTAYLDAAFAAIDQVSGGVDAYLETRLGVNGAIKDACRARLLV